MRYYRVTPDLSKLQLFGTPVMVHIEKEKRDGKFGRNSEKMVFVGYDETTKGYRCVNRETGKLKISRNVKSLSPSLHNERVTHEVRADE